MSCLPNCSCTKSIQEGDSEGEGLAHEPSYLPLLEAAYHTEAIPLLPKDSKMLKHEVKSEHYELLNVILGRNYCYSSTVSLALHIPTNQQVAVRRIDLDKCKEDLSYVQNEVVLARQLRHSNILPYYCAFVNQSEIWTIMPLMTYGSTKSLIKTHFKDGLPEIAISLIIKDVLLALEYLHKRGYIHRSVKASHILISGTGKAVLSGLRYSCNVFKDGRWQTVIHTFPDDSIPNLNWHSPELLGQNLQGYNSKSDIYSLGMTAWELLSGVTPFAQMVPTRMILEKLEGNIVEALDLHIMANGAGPDTPSRSSRGGSEQHLGSSMYISQLYSDYFRAFIQLCLQKDPHQRPSANQLLNHPFIKQSKKHPVSLIETLAIVSPLVEMLALNNSTIGDENLSTQLSEMDLTEEAWDF